MHGGAIRASLPAGRFTCLALINVLPSNYRLMVAEVTGDQLLHDIEANTGATPGAEGGFPQVSGIVYTVDTAKPYVEGEVNRVTIQSVGGRPFDPKETYTLVATEQLLTGGDKYRYMVGTPRKELKTTYERAVIDFVQQKLGGTIGSEYAEPQGRITILPSAAASSPMGLAGLVAGLCLAAVVCRRR